MGLRHKSIRLRVFLLIIIPVLTAIGLYAFAADVTVGAAVSLNRAQTVKNVTAVPTSALETELSAERSIALLYLARPAPQLLAALDIQEKKTDAVLGQFQTATKSAGFVSDASPEELRSISAVLKDTSGLGALRTEISRRLISRLAALTAYSNMVTAAYPVLEQAILQETSVPLVTQALADAKLDETYLTLFEERDLLASDLKAGSFPKADQVEFTELVAVRRNMLAATMTELNPAYQHYFSADIPSATASALMTLENTAISGAKRHGLPAVAATAWTGTADAYSAEFGKALGQVANEVVAGARADADSIYLKLILAGGLGLLAIILTILWSILIGRGLISQLAELRRSALELADERLPSIMARLRDGQDVDVSAEAPPLPATADEFGKVTEAFNAVQRTAIEAAVDEANLRRGVSDVFRNLARRSQSLLHRQLALIDGMERRASGPGELEDLFRIDHLTTRMRRQAESLIILSGESPGRRWHNPVPLIDVLRAAASEIEDYTRIKVVTRPQAALAGPAVADVIHLIAELAENATAFSPPNTPVQIFGDDVAQGFAIEIEDRGLGITDERLSEINNDLANPPQFDLSGSDRLGLFIAGQLAQRHNIKITLRRSPFGGTTAIVLIPHALIVDGPAAETELGSWDASERAIRPPDRHAALSQSGSIGPAWRLSREGSAPQAELPVAVTPEPPPVNTRIPDPPPVNQGSSGMDVWTPAAKPAIDPAAMGLPIRVPQASLAPQLADGSGPGTAPASEASWSGRPFDPPSPEAARSTMTALQRGWESGRSQAVPAPGDAMSAEPATGPAGRDGAE